MKTLEITQEYFVHILEHFSYSDFVSTTTLLILETLKFPLQQVIATWKKKENVAKTFLSISCWWVL